MTMENKLFGLAECKASKDEDRTIEFVATHEIIDYDSDIVKVDGMDINKLKSGNKSFLWSHQQQELPVGKIVSMKKNGNKITGKAKMTSEEEYPFGFQVYKLIKGGYINNVSVSFIPERDSIEYKEKGGKTVRIIGKSTALEVSAVNIGANKNATITSKSLKEATEKAWTDGVLDGTELNDFNEEIDKLKPVNNDEPIELINIAELKARVAELELQVKEQQLEEEIEDDIYTQIYEEFKPSSQDKRPEPIDEPIETLTIEALQNLIEEANNNG